MKKTNIQLNEHSTSQETGLNRLLHSAKANTFSPTVSE